MHGPAWFHLAVTLASVGSVLVPPEPPEVPRHVEAPAFGSAVCALDDLDGGGWPEIAVGAPLASTSRREACGAVIVLSVDQHAVLHRIDGDAAEVGFGCTLRRVDDLDGDGFGELLAGCDGHQQVQALSPVSGEPVWTWGMAGFHGEAWPRMSRVPDRDGDGVRDHLLAPPFRVRTDWRVLSGLRGTMTTLAPDASVALDDLDGDGLPELFRPAGGALVLSRSPSAPLSLTPAEPLQPATSPAARLDFDGDGVFDPLLGVSVRSGRDGRVLHRWSSDGLRRDSIEHDFGRSVLLPGDLDGDGRADVVISAPGFWDNQLFAFSGAAPGALLWRVLGDASSEALGVALDVLPDVDGDGAPEILVGDTDELFGSGPSPGRVWAASGRTGRELWEIRAAEVAGL